MNLPRADVLSVIEAPICCSVDPSPSGVRFHCALNVADLGRSVEFYRIFFGVRPAKRESDYAKFELTRPPLVFSLIPHPPGLGRGLRHFAFPVHHPSEVEALGVRLATAGLTVTWERNTVLDDARQTAVKVVDPDGNVWRVNCRLEDVDAVTEQPTGSTATTTSIPAAVGWEHRILLPCPESIPHADDSVDFVRLEGTFNADLTSSERTRFLTEVRRVLKPGGAVHVHGLASNRVLPTCPVLHGVAALVRRVPHETEPLEELRAVGLIDHQISKLPAKAVFQWDGIELREFKLSAWAPMVKSAGNELVLYRGPFARITTDDGSTFLRGVPQSVDSVTAAVLQREPWRGQFLRLNTTAAVSQSGFCTTRNDHATPVGKSSP